MFNNWLSLAIGALYIVVGAFVIKTGFFVITLERTARYGFGVLLILYGIFRIYRVIRKMREKRL